MTGNHTGWVEGMLDPHIVITGNPVGGFSYYGLTPLEDTEDYYREARTRRLEENAGEWWLAELRPLSDLEPIDGADAAPAVGPAAQARRALRAHVRGAVQEPFAEEALADLIAGLMHLAQESGLDPDAVVEHGISYYEVDNAPGLDPDDVADLVAHDAAAGLPGWTRVDEPQENTAAWAALVLADVPPATRRQVSTAVEVTLAAMAWAVLDRGPNVTWVQMLETVSAQVIDSVYGPGVAYEVDALMTWWRSRTVEQREASGVGLPGKTVMPDPGR